MTAIFSTCGLYRFRLEREIQSDGIIAALVGVNPSVANEQDNDRTITKEVGFGMRLGWRRIIKANVFPFISPYVEDLASVSDRRLQENARHIRQIATEADIVVVCWGRRSKLPAGLRPQLEATEQILRSLGKPLYHFGTTKSGDPLHTNRISYSLPLTVWTPRTARRS